MCDAPTYPPNISTGKPFCVIRTEEFKQQYGGHGGVLLLNQCAHPLYCFYMVNAPLHYSHYWKDADSRWPAKRYWL